jgi:predicted transcriptional regulator with HTH domain
MQVQLHHRSSRRSAVRSRLLLILYSRGALHGGHLATIAAIDGRRLHWAMHGCPPYYRIDLALVHAGLVEEVRSGRSVLYRLTTAGRAEARRLLSERRHREQG